MDNHEALVAIVAKFLYSYTDDAGVLQGKPYVHAVAFENIPRERKSLFVSLAEKIADASYDTLVTYEDFDDDYDDLDELDY